jgi:hypothetical protein
MEFCSKDHCTNLPADGVFAFVTYQRSDYCILILITPNFTVDWAIALLKFRRVPFLCLSQILRGFLLPFQAIIGAVT